MDKFVFAFLDVSDHLEAKKDNYSVENDQILPPPLQADRKIPLIYIYFFLTPRLSLGHRLNNIDNFKFNSSINHSQGYINMRCS